MNLIKNWGINIGLLIFSIIISFVIAEIVLRFASVKVWKVDYPRFYNKFDNISGYDISEEFQPTNFEFTDYQSIIWSNELGCFDQPYNKETDFILLVGDSFSWGFAPFEDTYGMQIENIIGKRVLKCGVMGYGTKQEGIKIEKIINKTGTAPKLIVVGYFLGGDLRDDYLFPQYTVIEGYLVGNIILKDIFTGERQYIDNRLLKEKVKNFYRYGVPAYDIDILTVKEFLKRHSKIYNLLKEMKILRTIGIKTGLVAPPLSPIEFMPMLSPKKVKWLKDAWVNHLNNIIYMKTLANKNGSKLLFVLIPMKEQVYEFLRPESQGVDWDLPNMILKDFLLRENINYIDLTPEFIKWANQDTRKISMKDLFWRYDPHWNNNGHRLAGLLVSKYILENYLINIKDTIRRLSKIEKELDKFKRELHIGKNF